MDSSADALSAEALALAERSSDTQAELETLAARHLVLSYPQAIDERTRLAARAVQLGLHTSTAMGALWGHLWQADIALQLGDLGRHDTEIDVIEQIAARRSAPVARWHWHRLLALRRCLTGEFDDAREHAAEARKIGDRVGDLSMLGMHTAFQIHLAWLRGDPQEIPDEAEAMLRQAPSIPLVQAGVAMVHALRGARDTARTSFEGLRRVPALMPLGPRWAATVSQIGLAATVLGDTEVAGECHRLLLQCSHWYGADGGGAPYLIGSIAFQLGLLSKSHGDLHTAVAHFERSIEADTRLGARPAVALARLEWAECLVARPDLAAEAGAASDLAGRAASELRLLDMPGQLARAQRLLDETAASSAAVPGGLTAREWEIAGLVAEALTNKQIADRLYLSVRTVESHVRSALAKAHLTTRTELAVWVHRAQQPGGPPMSQRR